MATTAHATAQTIRMKFTGHFTGKQKVVDLPIPFKSYSDTLPDKLVFVRESEEGPAFCDVPHKWANALLELGGGYEVAAPAKK